MIAVHSQNSETILTILVARIACCAHRTNQSKYIESVNVSFDSKSRLFSTIY